MNTKLLLAGGLLAISIASCKPEDEMLTGGKGGNVSLKISLRHHEDAIDSGKVYIKYAAKSKPPTFDDSAQVITLYPDTIATITGLTPGTYFLFGKAFDRGIGEKMEGGTPLIIKDDNQTYTISCPVAHTH